VASSTPIEAFSKAFKIRAIEEKKQMITFPTKPGRKFVNRARDIVMEVDFGTETPRVFHLTNRETGAQVTVDEDQLSFLAHDAKLAVSLSDEAIEIAARAAYDASRMVMGMRSEDRDFRTQIVEWRAIAKATIEATMPADKPLLMERMVSGIDAKLGIQDGADAHLRTNAVIDMQMNAEIMIGALKSIQDSAGGDGSKGTSGDGHQACIEQARNVLGLMAETAQGRAAGLCEWTGIVARDAAGSVVDENRGKLRGIAEFLKANAGRTISIVGDDIDSTFRGAVIMHSVEPVEGSTIGMLDYDTYDLLDPECPDVDGMIDDALGKDAKIMLESSEVQIEFDIPLAALTSVIPTRSKSSNESKMVDELRKSLYGDSLRIAFDGKTYVIQAAA
jgi:hypothetical protein